MKANERVSLNGIFQQRIREHQEKTGRVQSKSVQKTYSGLTESFIVLLIAIAAWFITDSGLLMQWTGISTGISNLIGTGSIWLGAIACAFMIFEVGALLYKSATTTKRVICPVCNSESIVDRKLDKYMCDHCGEMLYLGQDTKIQPELSPCPYCKHSTAITIDHGAFLCPDCGAVRVSQVPLTYGEEEKCPKCGNEVPEGAIFCKNCNEIINYDFVSMHDEESALHYDIDWVAGKSKQGHLLFAKAALEGIRKKARWEIRDLSTLKNYLQKLELAMLSLGTILEDRWYAEEIRKMVPLSDEAYYEILAAEFNVLSTINKDKFYKDWQVEQIVREYHIKARKEIENIFGEQILEAGSVGPWNGHLIAFNDSPDDDLFKIRDISRMQEEVGRFNEWVQTRHLASA